MKPYMRLYQHYKGNLYYLLYIGKHTETEELFVVYSEAISSSEEPEEVWIRPLSMFNEEVEYNGKIVKRFERLS